MPVWSFWSRLGLHRRSFTGALREVGSVYRPGRITTRSLLRERLTAGWIALYLQRASRRWLKRSRRLPSLRESLRELSEGRYL